MSKTSRRKFSSEFKAKVSIEAIKEQQTIEALSKKYDLHPTQINTWKREFLSNSSAVFEKDQQSMADDKEGLIQALYAQIGEQKVAIDFLKKNCSKAGKGAHGDDRKRTYSFERGKAMRTAAGKPQRFLLRACTGKPGEPGYHEGTVCSALRFMGMKDEPCFHKYHRVLSRVKWSALQASRILLSLLIKCFGTSEEPLVFGIDETIERRRGDKIKARGIYRDPVRSSHAHFVKCSGLRWISLMMLGKIKWADRIWALPFLTVLAPSERYCHEHARHHKTVTEWARQMILRLHRWLPEKSLVIVADSSYAALELLASVRSYVSFITRLRLDAALYDPVAVRQSGQMGRPKLKGARQLSLNQRIEHRDTCWKTIQIARWYNELNKKVEVSSGVSVWYSSGMAAVPIRWVLIKDGQRGKKPVALLSTDVSLQPEAIIDYFIRRWSMEVTFKEVREQLGVETQRQWSDQAILCTTPSLMGLFSIVTLWANSLFRSRALKIQPTAWYEKKHPTFSDALAAVRRQIWQQKIFCVSEQQGNMIKVPKALFRELTELLTRAA